MKFGKISYINLLPFDVFVKRFSPKPNFFLPMINYYKNYPSKLNKEFLFRRIDAGFISSIAGMKSRHSNAGIISIGAVWSVIVIKKDSKFDYQSASSNALSKLLNINGEVLIGDRALEYIISNNNYIDLGLEWFKKYRLPFVFGLLCFNKHNSFYKRLADSFIKHKINIPTYLLINKSKESGLPARYIKQYLTRIHYKIDSRAQISLFRFYRAIRLHNIKPPGRFK